MKWRENLEPMSGSDSPECQLATELFWVRIVRYCADNFGGGTRGGGEKGDFDKFFGPLRTLP